MKTRSRFIQKVYIFLALSALAFGADISALASSTSTTLLTVVPTHVVVNVTIVGGGSVVINETKLTQSAQISIKRKEAVQICLLPEYNNRVISVIYNGISVVDKVNNGEILLPALEKNAELKVTFAISSTTPDTRDTGVRDVIYRSIMAIISFIAIILISVKRIWRK